MCSLNGWLAQGVVAYESFVGPAARSAACAPLLAHLTTLMEVAAQPSSS